MSYAITASFFCVCVFFFILFFHSGRFRLFVFTFFCVQYCLNCFFFGFFFIDTIAFSRKKRSQIQITWKNLNEKEDEDKTAKRGSVFLGHTIWTEFDCLFWLVICAVIPFSNIHSMYQSADLLVFSECNKNYRKEQNPRKKRMVWQS